MSQPLLAFGLGTGTRSAAGAWLEVLFPQPLRNPSPAIIGVLDAWNDGAGLTEPTEASLLALARALERAGETAQATLARSLQGNTERAVVVALRQEQPPHNVPEAYLKLQLLSHRLCRPHEQNLDGLFAVLPNVAWTSEGARPHRCIAKGA